MNELSLSRFKKCYKCGCTKPATKQFFSASKDLRYGLRNDCKPCAYLSKKAWDDSNRDHVRQYQLEKYHENPEKYQQKANEYAAANRELVNSRRMLYYENNKEMVLAKQKKYRRENAELVKKQEAKRRKDNPEIHRGKHRRRRALRFNAEHEPYTAHDLNAVWHKQRGFCHYCATPLFAYYHIEHKTPLSRGGADKLSNICLACPTCNLRKGTKTAEEFMGGSV